MPPALAPTTVAAVTIDAFLGGRVEAVQPADGHHRSGLDAVLLAAALGNGTAGRVIDLGAGAGVAGLCLAARAGGVSVVLAEREVELGECAEAALARPANSGFAHRVMPICADILTEPTRRAAELLPGSFDHALMNPPFHDEGSVRASPKDARAKAHVLGEAGLDGWFRAAAALVRPGGSLAVILPAARLGDLIAGTTGRFGGLVLLPIHPRADVPAIRILALGIKGSRAPSRLLPGLLLHAGAGRAFTGGVAALLRDGASLFDIHPAFAEAAPPSADPGAAASEPESRAI